MVLGRQFLILIKETIVEKKEFVKLIDEVLKPLKFKKKGDNWIFESNEIKKIVNLQKSKYANSYYLNYGYIINKLEIRNLQMHVLNRLSSVDDAENNRINTLLDFESCITDVKRLHDLRNLIENNLIAEFQRVDNESDLLQEIKKRPTLNDVPLVVKKHFGLE